MNQSGQTISCELDIDSSSASDVLLERGSDVSEASTSKAPSSSISEPSLAPPIGLMAATACGLLAAVLYTAANVALRYCVNVDPSLVSAVKAAPTVLFLAPMLIFMRQTGRTIATSYHALFPFVIASFFGQVVGNGAFQVALGVIGLAASVPITLGVLIIGGAVLGRVMLKEPVNRRTILAMVLLIAAVITLSLPNATDSPSTSVTSLPIWVGGLCAAASGAAYAFFGVRMRQALTGGMSPQVTMFISGVVGTVALWLITTTRMDAVALAEVDMTTWAVMSAAGTFNFLAFSALSLALKSLPVVAVNLINASQVAMAAFAGVLLFGEPITALLMMGIALTLLGLAVLANFKASPKGSSSQASLD